MSAISTRLRKLEQAVRTPDPMPPACLQFSEKSTTGFSYVSVFDGGQQEVFEPLPNETHEQTLRRAYRLAKRGEIHPYIVSHES